jgi:ATP-dependent DNA helicase RecG
MFLLIGLGERGGSGVPKIYSGWRSQHWRPPALHEKAEPEQTLLELRMLDLLPEGVVEQLRERFGVRFESLEHTARLILATAAIERVVSHNRLLEICDTHAHDLSQLLARLVRERFLVPDGRSRGMIYHLPGEQLPTPEQVFAGPLQSSEHYSDSSEHKVEFDTRRNDDGCLLSDHIDAPLIDALDRLDAGFRQNPKCWLMSRAIESACKRIACNR